MRMVGSASAQRPQKMHLPRSSVAEGVLHFSPEEIAPVGQAAVAGRAAFQLAKSISGRPRRAAPWAAVAGTAGYAVVTMPVAKLLVMSKAGGEKSSTGFV